MLRRHRRRRPRRSHNRPQHVVPRDQPLPLSSAQEALWLIDRMQGRSEHYNEFGAHRIRGPLSVDALSRALSELVRRLPD